MIDSGGELHNRPSVDRDREVSALRTGRGAAIGACGVRLDRVRVAERDLFAPPGQAFKLALQGISAARVYVSAMACAVVETALQTAVAYAAERHSFARPLLDHQGLRWSLVDVAADLEAARLLTLQGAHAVARGDDAQIEAALAKKVSAEMAARSVTACMQAMGAVGLLPQYGFGRLMTSARIAAYVDGMTEMQNERIGAALFKRYGGSSLKIVPTRPESADRSSFLDNRTGPEGSFC
jgi:alkylation response protein AidB-like acyl-CoA dehydrogenase